MQLVCKNPSVNSDLLRKIGLIKMQDFQVGRTEMKIGGGVGWGGRHVLIGWICLQVMGMFRFQIL